MNNDLISRNDLEKFKILPFDKASYDDTEINAAYQNGWNDAIDRIINNAPTIDIKDQIAGAYNEGYMCGSREAEKARPQGEWIVYGRQGGIPITDYCSNCKYEMMWFKNKYKFCPNCGADMKGGAE